MSKTVAKYQQYAEYKDSGVEWLGEIPSHWQTKKLKFILLDLVRGPFGSALKKEFFLDSGFKVYEQKNCIRNDVTIGNSYISKKMFQELDRFSIRENDLLMSCSGTIGKVVRVPESFEQGIINQALLIMRLNKNIVDLNYFLHVFRSSDIQNQIKDNTQGGAMQNLVATDIFKSISITVPKIEEQTQIANFLDHETAKIDSLIEKQQQLIQLLKEKRQAVISHAVTKGLDPNVPMKDSGVEWLGEVPEHWKNPKLLHITNRIGDGLHATPIYEDGSGYYFINGNNLVNGKVRIGSTAKEVPYSEYIKHQVLLNEQTVLLSINGTIGSTALYNNEPVILGKSAAYINCLNILLPSFLMLFLTTDQAKYYYNLEATGTTIFNLSLSSIRNMRIPLPSIEEQKEIVGLCSQQNSKYEYLINVATSKMNLLQERRTALISAAVTGKIDVRDWQNPHAGLGTQLNKAFKTAGLVNAGFTLPERPIE